MVPTVLGRYTADLFCLTPQATSCMVRWASSARNLENTMNNGVEQTADYGLGHYPRVCQNRFQGNRALGRVDGVGIRHLSVVLSRSGRI